MNILAIDTSSTSGSIAIARDKEIIYSNYMDIKITHSERLMPQIAFALKKNNLKPNDIDLIAIANGPGSFTGIRIGLSTAKGMAFGLEIPIVPFNSLEMIAANLYKCKENILVFQDARMNEVYAALYDSNLEVIIPPQNALPDDFLDKITTPVVIIGDGYKQFKENIIRAGINYRVPLLHQNIPSATSLISLVHKMEEIPEFDFEFISTLEPYYMRKSQAELMHQKKVTFSGLNNKL